MLQQAEKCSAIFFLIYSVLIPLYITRDRGSEKEKTDSFFLLEGDAVEIRISNNEPNIKRTTEYSFVMLMYLVLFGPAVVVIHI